MNEATRDRLRPRVAQAREALEANFREQLEARYGIRSDGQSVPLERLTHLSYAGRARRQAILDAVSHAQAGGSRIDSIARYVREAAFTALNRLAALKLMEAENRKLIRPSVGAYRDSAGFKEFTQISPELCLGLLDGGYQIYLELLFDDLSNELGVLFDRDLPQSLLFPSEACLRAVLEILNHPELADIWPEDETIGWIYQFFTPKQMRDQARKESAAPRNSYELAFRNQFFTPRYVVEFLVDNTLGRLWWEMRGGDTVLVECCRYLLRPPDEPIRAREKRDPRSLRLIDPAAGSGHFLLYGFDLLEVIYAEAYDDPELGSALRHDFPDLAGYQRAVPELILRNNLYGIDIDLRAAQIAALALWLRAQRSYQAVALKVANRPRIRRVNVVTAEPMPGNADLMREFLDGLDNPAVRELVETLWQAMQAADEIGSLLKIEQRLAEAAAQAKQDWSNLAPLVQGQMFAPDQPKSRQLNFEYSFIQDERFWQQVEELVLVELRRMAGSAANGHAYGRRLFAEDAERGFAFIDLLRQPFDCVWMNPPFGAVSKGAKPYVEKQYSRTKNDLYAAFVERGLELLRPRGLLGAITSRTGFFLTSFRKWREEVLIPTTNIIAVADLGFGVLDTAMVETAAYVLEKLEPT